jgi:hypothetical protein
MPAAQAVARATDARSQMHSVNQHQAESQPSPFALAEPSSQLEGNPMLMNQQQRFSEMFGTTAQTKQTETDKTAQSMAKKDDVVSSVDKAEPQTTAIHLALIPAQQEQKTSAIAAPTSLPDKPAQKTLDAKGVTKKNPPTTATVVPPKPKASARLPAGIGALKALIKAKTASGTSAKGSKAKTRKGLVEKGNELVAGDAANVGEKTDGQANGKLPGANGTKGEQPAKPESASSSVAPGESATSGQIPDGINSRY